MTKERSLQFQLAAASILAFLYFIAMIRSLDDAIWTAISGSVVVLSLHWAQISARKLREIKSLKQNYDLPDIM